MLHACTVLMMSNHMELDKLLIDNLRIAHCSFVSLTVA